MAKDPAVLFYTNDFLSRTFTMSDEQVGKYIRLLCIQHQQDYLTEQDMLNICKSYDSAIYGKFIKEDGKYYNERMRDEAQRRRLYSESRKNNRNSTKDNKICKTYVKHMETGTITETEIVNVIDSYNVFAEKKGLVKVIKVTDKRKSNIKNRLTEKDFNFENILQRIDESDFLKGKNKEGWRVDFDFIFGSKNNYIKILEGKYGNNKNNGGASPEFLRELVERRAAKERNGD